LLETAKIFEKAQLKIKMPQGRRKVPFSGKQKKLQMKQKQLRKDNQRLQGDTRRETIRGNTVDPKKDMDSSVLLTATAEADSTAATSTILDHLISTVDSSGSGCQRYINSQNYLNFDKHRLK